jgi:DNA-binding transcriptional LysR family regulator
VQALVRLGLGIAVVPQLLLDRPDETLATIPVGHLVPDRVIALTTRSNGGRTPAAELAAAILRARE